MSDQQQQQSPAAAAATPYSSSFPPSRLDAQDLNAQLSDPVSNEEIDAFLSANPEFTARAMEEAAGGSEDGALGSMAFNGQDFSPGYGNHQIREEDLNALEKMAGLTGFGTGKQQMMPNMAQISPPNSLSPDDRTQQPSLPPTSQTEKRSLSPFSNMMAQAGVPPTADVLTPPASSAGSTISSGSGSGDRVPTQRTIAERRLDKAVEKKMLQSAPSAKTLPQVGRPMTGLYSSSGFDVLGALSRVVSRPNPRVNLGPVDFSCSFLVVDIRKEDCPIVYSSPTFSVLTGYENKEILGKNCRFLQGPDGQVAQGSRRKYTDNVAVSHLKRNLSQGRECQASLINYRKDGSPFINLVTVVPIPWDTEEIAFHVGFQVDLVESPNAILKNISDGTYQVNYAVLNNPQNPLAPPPVEAGKGRSAGAEMKDIVRLSGRKDARDVVANLEQAQEHGEDFSGDAKDLEKELMMEWYKSLSEHSDDFIHVLSLKGQFQYVSPSVRRILDYDPEDLKDKFISDICHPSDVVPIMRELKDSTQAPPPGQAAKTVNFLCRVERKTGGTVWLECSGRLYIEPGKGRKAVILSGRERVMPKLDWSAIGAMGGIGGGTMEGWGMMSFEGLILYASNELKEIYGASGADGLLGESLLDFIPPSEGSSRHTPESKTVSPANLSVPFSEPIHQQILNALKLASRGQPAQSGVTIRHQIVVPCGALSSRVSGSGSSNGGSSSSSSNGSSNGRLPIVQEVATTIYAIQRESRAWHDLNPGASPHGSGSPFGSDNTDSFPIEAGVGPSQNKLKQTTLVFQVKLLSHRPASTGGPPMRATVRTSFQTVHDPASDVFEALDTTRSSGWQYELHQLKNENRRMKDRIAAARSGKVTGADDGATRKKAPSNGSAQAKRKRDLASQSHSPASAVSPGAALMPPPAPPPQQQQQQQTHQYQPQYTQDWTPSYSPAPQNAYPQYSIQPPPAQYYQPQTPAYQQAMYQTPPPHQAYGAPPPQLYGMSPPHATSHFYNPSYSS